METDSLFPGFHVQVAEQPLIVQVAKPAKRNRKKPTPIVSQADVFMEVARRNGWEAKAFGHGQMITKPMTVNGWILKPADLSESTIPAEGLKRLFQEVNAGVKIKGIVIADDARKYQKQTAVNSEANRSNANAGKVAGGLLLGMVAVAAVVGVGVLEAALVIGSAATSVILFDPVLVAVLESGEWITCYEWWD